MNAFICAIAKNENDYIVEWVEYHLKLGFESIFICDNNNQDDDSLAELLKGYTNVYVGDARGQTSWQMNSYNFFYSFSKHCEGITKDDYIAFIDIDEFITLNPKYKTINDYLDTVKEFDIVHLNWMTYGSNGQLTRTEGNVIDRFKEPIYPLDFKNDKYPFPHNNHVKSLVKVGLDVKFTWNPHTPYGENIKVCNADGKIVENTPFTPYTFNNAYIRHYCTKSLEEWKNNKMSRRYATDENFAYSLDMYYFFNKKDIF
jgi:hypothetical protein